MHCTDPKWSRHDGLCRDMYSNTKCKSYDYNTTIPPWHTNTNAGPCKPHPRPHQKTQHPQSDKTNPVKQIFCQDQLEDPTTSFSRNNPPAILPIGPQPMENTQSKWPILCLQNNKLKRIALFYTFPKPMNAAPVNQTSLTKPKKTCILQSLTQMTSNKVSNHNSEPFDMEKAITTLQCSLQDMEVNTGKNSHASPYPHPAHCITMNVSTPIHQLHTTLWVTTQQIITHPITSRMDHTHPHQPHKPFNFLHNATPDSHPRNDPNNANTSISMHLVSTNGWKWQDMSWCQTHHH